MSPSTRRVWIEIQDIATVAKSLKSPSTRRVWIEIGFLPYKWMTVKRHPPPGRCGLKYTMLIIFTKFFSHPPPGGCGLKFVW
jgi:hypothetical protein